MKYYEHQIIKLLTLLKTPIAYKALYDIMEQHNMLTIDGDTLFQVLTSFEHSEYVTEDHGIFEITPKGLVWLNLLNERTKQ